MNRAWQTFVLAALASAAIWALTPWLSDQREPWDVAGIFYYAALFIAGLIAGLLQPRPLWAHYFGSIAGQIGYELIFLRVGPLLVIGAILLFFYCVFYLVGAYIGGYVRKRLKRQTGNDGT
ncbi:MAG: hypothetical protein FJ145_05525 [Deltaproteobacteria bacterium]|nr:hypothetical protein [Deltaproteobacteria bacterium]